MKHNVKKMDPRVKKLWVEALHSGRFIQGRGQLYIPKDSKAGDRYCCLGVLCKLYEEETKDPIAWFEGSPEGSPTGLLPQKVVDWAGLKASNPEVRWAGMRREKLAPLNDEGHTFETIAELIEEQL